MGEAIPVCKTNAATIAVEPRPYRHLDLKAGNLLDTR
jgi:hypothetical protein